LLAFIQNKTASEDIITETAVRSVSLAATSHALLIQTVKTNLKDPSISVRPHRKHKHASRKEMQIKCYKTITTSPTPNITVWMRDLNAKRRTEKITNGRNEICKSSGRFQT
jgi:hypothetical protein